MGKCRKQGIKYQFKPILTTEIEIDVVKSKTYRLE